MCNIAITDHTAAANLSVKLFNHLIEFIIITL